MQTYTYNNLTMRIWRIWCKFCFWYTGHFQILRPLCAAIGVDGCILRFLLSKQHFLIIVNPLVHSFFSQNAVPQANEWFT